MLKRTAVPFYSKAERLHHDDAARFSRAGLHAMARQARAKAIRQRDRRIAAHARRMAAAGKLMLGRPMSAALRSLRRGA